MPRVAPQLRHLHEAGFVLAIDDFGAGHSSLARLRDLPVDILKVDRRSWPPRGGPAGLGHRRRGPRAGQRPRDDDGGRGRRDRGPAPLPARCRVPVAQGFHLGRPVPFAAMTELLAARACAEAGESPQRRPPRPIRAPVNRPKAGVTRTAPRSRSAYFSAIGLRLSFIVGVSSSPPGTQSPSSDVEALDLLDPGELGRWPRRRPRCTAARTASSRASASSEVVARGRAWPAHAGATSGSSTISATL